ncbi:MAG TPA: pectate lyase [Polyangia bacterium]
MATAGWGCATGEAVEPSGAAGDNGGGGNGGTTGAAGAAGTGNDTAGTTGTAGSNATGGTTGSAGTGGTTGAAGAGGTTGRGGTTGTGGSTAGRGGTTGVAGTTGAAGTTGSAGRGGTTGTAGRGGTTGTAGRGGTTGTAGATGSGGAPSSNLCTWPTANGSQSVSSTINVSGTYDGGMKRFTGSGALGSSGQTEGQPAMFQISNGGTLTNVIIGNPAADGVHCSGSCTLKNVWWEDVGEDAATLLGSSSSQVMTIDTGGAKGATDKVFQHNGPGTMIVRNFCFQDFGKAYRSCGNCSSQYARHLEMDNIMAVPRLGPLAGVNANYNDTAKFTRILIKASSGTICDRYNGNSTGAEPTKIGSGADGTNCIYSSSDITYMP